MSYKNMYREYANAPAQNTRMQFGAFKEYTLGTILMFDEAESIKASDGAYRKPGLDYVRWLAESNQANKYMERAAYATLSWAEQLNLLRFEERTVVTKEWRIAR